MGTYIVGGMGRVYCEHLPCLLDVTYMDQQVGLFITFSLRQLRQKARKADIHVQYAFMYISTLVHKWTKGGAGRDHM